MKETAVRIRILVVDDHALFREGLARLLGGEAGIEVAAHCATAAEGLLSLASKPVDVVLLDADLGDERGLDFLVAARRTGFTGPVLIVTAGLAQADAARLIGAGAAGIFLKEGSAQQLANAIRTIADGRAWIDQRWLTTLVGSRPSQHAESSGGLTDREREALRGVLDGLANKEIAVRLGVSESAVKATLQQLFHKTGVRTRSQLVRVALEQYAGEL